MVQARHRQSILRDLAKKSRMMRTALFNAAFTRLPLSWHANASRPAIPRRWPWLQKSCPAVLAEKGVTEARFQAALLMLEGKYLTKDEARAKDYLTKAVEAGHKLAAFNLAQLIASKARSDADRKKAYDLFLQAADAGLADAQYAVSQFLANGTGGVPFDETKAREWLEKAARQSYDTAMLDYASWLIDGIGGKKDYEAGFLWMKRAAESGNVAAQRQLARLYENGIGVKGDTVTAAAWYVVAKRAGLHDPKLDDLLDGLTEEEMKRAIETANRLK